MTHSLDAGQIITFYSYKGGTGRTMALANVACLLAQNDKGTKSVLAIDWDLEAPGLHLFFRGLLTQGSKDQAKAEALLDGHEGLIDLFVLIRDSIEKAKTSWNKNEAVLTEAEATELLRQIGFDRFVLSTGLPGLHLLKAGRFDSEYSRRVNTFQWEALYNRCPSLFQCLADFLAKRYDYVLIDSRTGRTDTSNICTMLMPQKLVVVFTPNRQSLTGIEDLIRRATDYRRKSDDFRTLLVYPLPSRIENSEIDLKKWWRSGNDEQNIVGYQLIFETIFKDIYDLPECNLLQYFDSVQVHHVPAYAYGEELSVMTERNSDISSLHFRFKRFCDWIVDDAAPWEPSTPVRGETGTALEDKLFQPGADFLETDKSWGPPLKLFLSYSHKDAKYVAELHKDLKLMERNGLIQTWSDRALESAERWEARVLQELREADVIVCQLSRDFLNSDFFSLTELHIAIRRKMMGSAELIAYVLTECGWREVPRLKDFQILPRGARPLSNWKDKNAYWRSVAEGIQDALKRLRKQRSQADIEHAMAKKHIFLSYYHGNKEEVARLRKDLMAAGETVWWDEEIRPGQDWKLEIHRALKNAYVVVLCLSKESEAGTTSGIYPEAVDVISAYREYVTGGIFLIPVRLSECEIPPLEIDGTRTLDQVQYQDLFPTSNYAAGLKKLVRAIQATPHHPH